MTRGCIRLALLCALALSVAPAQLHLESISVTAGIMRSTHSEEVYSDYFYPFYPEIQIRTTFLRPDLYTGVYWGYWNDRISEPVHDILTLTYSAQAHILGGRIGYRPPVLGPVDVFLGYAHHLVTTRYVGGYDPEGKPGRNFFQQFNTLEAGLGADVGIVGPLALRATILHQFLIGGSTGYGTQDGRLSLNVGLAYRVR